MMNIVHGQLLAKKMEESLRKARAQFSFTPGLGIVLIEGDAPSSAYVKRKVDKARELEIRTEVVRLPHDATTEDVVEAILTLDRDEHLDGIMVQLPLPAHIDRTQVLSAIPPSKDVDVLSPDARARFAHEEFPILPPVVGAVQYIFEAYTVHTLGREVLVLGHGILVGAPLAQFMRQCGARVTVVDQPVRDLTQFTKDAQVIICGAGVPHLLKPEHVSEGVVVIDAGMQRVEGKLVGDAHPDVALHSSLFTPTPGGVGPLVVVSLLKNVLILARARAHQ
jgi:methylenetetrahydrofolate dehydrogenase (NADP+)/methenyltetrahydrofolate cyclohydrolase